MNLRTADGAPVVATANLSFKIDENAADQPLYFLDHFRASAQNGVAAYLRALEAVAQKEGEKAAAYLVQALNANPTNTFATELLVSQYFRTGKFDRVVELAEKLGMQPFQAAPETRAQLSVSFWQAGRPMPAACSIPAPGSSPRTRCSPPRQETSQRRRPGDDCRVCAQAVSI